MLHFDIITAQDEQCCGALTFHVEYYGVALSTPGLIPEPAPSQAMQEEA